ncbi:hypothetical protein DFH11DRAFT_1546205 [Phellopilus nigrolimitatus]|nr:hypothetical protein DFH11DRAFT_1546205 [Phellopilus nigrolimitatus]
MADLSLFTKDCLKSPFAARVLCDEASSLVSAYLSLLLEHLREEWTKYNGISRCNDSNLMTLDDLRAEIKKVESEMAFETVQVVIYHQRLRHAQRAIKRLESKKKQLLVKADEIVLKESRRPSLPMEIVADILSLAHDAHNEANKTDIEPAKKSNVLKMALSLGPANPWRRAILLSLTLPVFLGRTGYKYSDFKNNELSKLSMSYGSDGTYNCAPLPPLKLQSSQCSELRLLLSNVYAREVDLLQPFLSILPSFRSLEVITYDHISVPIRSLLDKIEKIKGISTTNIRHAAFSLHLLPNMLGSDLCTGIVSLFIHIPLPCAGNLVERLRHISKLHVLTRLTISSFSPTFGIEERSSYKLIDDDGEKDSASQFVPDSLRDLNFIGFKTTFISSALRYLGSRKIQAISINCVPDVVKIMYAVHDINKRCPSLERLECDLTNVGWKLAFASSFGPGVAQARLDSEDVKPLKRVEIINRNGGYEKKEMRDVDLPYLWELECRVPDVDSAFSFESLNVERKVQGFVSLDVTFWIASASSDYCSYIPAIIRPERRMLS